MVHITRSCILSNKFIINLFLSIALIIIFIYTQGNGVISAINQPELSSPQAPNDDFHEDLYIRPLGDGKLLAHFQFITTYRKDIKSLRWENKIEILPLSIVDLVTTTGLTELHFSLTKGNWNYQNWGYLTRSSPPGAQIRASFTKHRKNLNDTWKRLINSLAGKFCASLASADEHTLVMPKLSFGSDASLSSSSVDDLDTGHINITSSREQVLYANLPEETLCTGNLTPWKKLLPCYSNSGLASLLNAIDLFKSAYSSLAVELEPRQCLDEHDDIISGCERVQLKLSTYVVFNPLLQFEGKQSWSLTKIFGANIKRVCPLARHSLVHVDITELDDKTKLYPQQSYQEYSLNIGLSKQSAIQRIYATFDLKSLILNGPTDKPLNLGIKQNQIFKRATFSSRKTIPVSLRTHITNVGAYDGTIVATVVNSLGEPIRITYMDIVPHFMRLYLHTLHIRSTKSGQELKPDKLNFLLSRDDTTPTLIEFSLILPAYSETQISYDFERAFLRWTDFKPDANKGVLLGSAMIAVPTRYMSVMEQLAIPLSSLPGKVKRSNSPNSNATSSTLELQFLGADEEMVKIYSRPLLVILPTPDFSMPYNVLCLVCTVLVFAFGPIYNLTIRRPVIRRRKQLIGGNADTKASKKND